MDATVRVEALADQSGASVRDLIGANLATMERLCKAAIPRTRQEHELVRAILRDVLGRWYLSKANEAE